MLTSDAGREREAGSLAIAISIVLILSVLAVGALARTVASQKASRDAQDFAAALPGADSAIADVLFALDQGKTGDFTGLVNVSSPVGSKGTAVEYWATNSTTNPLEYTVLAKGKVNGRVHAVVAEIESNPLFQYGIFTVNSFVAEGNCKNQSQQPIGSSGTLDSGSDVCNDVQDCYDPPTGNPPGNQGDCADKGEKRVYGDWPIPAGTFTPCPSTISGTIPGGTTYKCSQAAVTVDTLTISPPGVVRIYAPSTTALTIAESASINTGGNPKNLEIYANGASSKTYGGNGGTQFTGTLYGPHMSMRFNGQGNMDIVGAVVLYDFTQKGAPHVNAADPAISSRTLGDWKRVAYREVSSACSPPGTGC